MHAITPAAILFAIACVSALGAAEPAGPAAAPRPAPEPPDPAAQARAAYARGERRIRIAPGVYRLNAAKGEFHQEFRDLRDCEIDARGVTFVFGLRDRRGVIFADCARVRFHGATLLREVPPFSQGDVVAVNAAEKCVDVAVHPGYPDDLLDERYFYRTPVLTAFAPGGRRLKPGVPDLYVAKVAALGDRKFRFHLREALDPRIPLRPGDQVAWRGGKPQGMCGHELDVVHCAGLRLENVTIKNARGGAVVERGGEGGNYYNFVLTYADPPAGASHPPLLSGSADAFLSGNARRGPTLENCLWEGSHDDNVNIHGAIATVTGAESPQSLLVDVPNDDAKDNFRPGDVLKFFDPAGGLRAEARLTALTPIAGATRTEDVRGFARAVKGFRLRLDREIPARAGWRFCNYDAIGNGFVVRGCVSRMHRAHGFFLRAGRGVVENCTLEDIHMAGIVVAPEFGHWAEGGYAEDLIIRNNVLRRVGLATQPWNSGVSVNCWQNGAFTPLPGGHRRVTIADNLFEDNDGPNLMLSSAIDVQVRGNRFVRPMRRPQYRPQDFAADYGALIWATECERLTLADNTVTAPGPEMRRLISASVNVTGQGLLDGAQVTAEEATPRP